jgi:transcriptional regulator with GAF, ATPase, and Fis domain
VVAHHARIIAATNQEPLLPGPGASSANDIYFLLTGFKLAIPPLRERRRHLAAISPFLKRAPNLAHKILSCAQEAAAIMRHHSGRERGELENSSKPDRVRAGRERPRPDGELFEDRFYGTVPEQQAEGTSS